MNKKALIVIILVVAVLLIVGYKLYSSKVKGVAGLKVVSNPIASIFLNDKLIGKTPYEEKHPSGEYIIKLIPDSIATQVASWQGKINLTPQLLTFVQRDLGISELTSAGEILFLEKITDKEAQVAIFSSPDASTVLLDGQEKGITPLILRDVVEGEHDIAITSPGFLGRTVRIQAVSGYKLSVNFQLALSSVGKEPVKEGSNSSTSSDQGMTKPYIIISDTPTGFLRVRSGPSTQATEAARVKPGEKYKLLGEEKEWFKILYDTNKEGWISGKYAQKVE